MADLRTTFAGIDAPVELAEPRHRRARLQGRLGSRKTPGGEYRQRQRPALVAIWRRARLAWPQQELITDFTWRMSRRRPAGHRLDRSRAGERPGRRRRRKWRSRRCPRCGIAPRSARCRNAIGDVALAQAPAPACRHHQRSPNIVDIRQRQRSQRRRRRCAQHHHLDVFGRSSTLQRADRRPGATEVDGDDRVDGADQRHGSRGAAGLGCAGRSCGCR